MAVLTALSQNDVGPGWLDVPGASTADLVQVQIYGRLHGGDNQLWTLVEEDHADRPFPGRFYGRLEAVRMYDDADPPLAQGT